MSTHQSIKFHVGQTLLDMTQRSHNFHNWLLFFK